MDDKIQIQKVLRALKVNKFNALYAKNRDEARKIMLDLIPLAAMVGVGDSGTIRQIGIIPALEERGTVVVSSGAMDMGQGLKTVLAQIVAEELGVYVDDITVISGDTDSTPFDVGIFGDRGTHTAGLAAKMAAMDAKNQILDLAIVKISMLEIGRYL